MKQQAEIVYYDRQEKEHVRKEIKEVCVVYPNWINKDGSESFHIAYFKNGTVYKEENFPYDRYLLVSIVLF